MKKLRGSSEYLAKHLMREVQVDMAEDINGRMKPIFGRYEMKQMALEFLSAEGKKLTPSNVAKEMPVYSKATNFRYSYVWTRFFDHVRFKYNVNDVDKINVMHVEDFMRTNLRHDVKLSSFKTYTAAMNKLEVAMNRTRKTPLYFSEKLKKLTAEATTKLKNFTPARAYRKPEVSILKIEDATYQIAANLQLQGGARVREITELKPDRNLKGVVGNYGYILLTNTKGGRLRTMRIPADLYRQVESIANEHGVFKFTVINYTRTLQKALTSSGEKWNGSHGLRWNYAQKRFYELQSVENKSFKEALQLVSNELGHSRPSITYHYLR